MTKRKNGETLEDIRLLLPYIDYLVPNEEEISLLTGEKDPYKNIKILLEAGVKNVVIKCGAKGCIIGNRNGVVDNQNSIIENQDDVIANQYAINHIPAVEGINCVDTTGAGDSFAAGFLYGLSNGWDVVECGRYACAVASCAVEQVGAVDGVKDSDKIMERYRGLKEVTI